MHDSIAKSRFFAYNKCGERGGGAFEPRFSSLGELTMALSCKALGIVKYRLLP